MMLSPDGDSHHTRSHLALEFVVLCDIEKKEGYAFPRTCGLAFPSLPGPRLAPAEGRSLNSRPLGMMICSVVGYLFIIGSGTPIAFPSLPGMTSRVLKRSLLPDGSSACACGRSLAEFSPTRYDDL